MCIRDSYNAKLPNLNKIISSKLNILHSNPQMKKKFPRGAIKPIYRRNPNLKEILSPSRFPKQQHNNKFVHNFCNRCDLCKNFLNKKSTFRCTVTGQVYRIRGTLSCNSKYVIYLITCQRPGCHQQYVGSAEDFKPRGRVHKSDNHLNNVRCGAAKHFNGNCKHATDGANGYFNIQIIEVLPPTQQNDEYLLRREQYWQAQLFTITHGMNSSEDWYSNNRKGYRK